jgi:hypothetical protein
LPSDLYAAQYPGELTKMANQALPAKLGLEEKPAAVMNRENRQKHEMEQRLAREQHAAQMETTRQGGRLSAEQERQRNRLAIQDRMDARSGEGGTGGKIKVSGNLPAFHKVIQAAVDEVAHGEMRGVKVPLGHAQLMRQSALIGAPDSDTADAVAHEMAQNYAELIGKGVDPQRALRVVRNEDTSLYRDEDGTWKVRMQGRR